MDAQISTAFSDLVLSSSALWSILQISVDSDIDYSYSKWWFMLQSIAALLGVFKFGRLLENHQSSVEKYHKNFSCLSVAIGIPCLGAQFCSLHNFTLTSQVFLGCAILSFVICLKKPNLKEKFPMMVSASVILCLGFLGLKGSDMNLCCATLLFIMSAVVGDEGTVPIVGLPRVDLFHYIITAVNILTVRSLLKH